MVRFNHQINGNYIICSPISGNDNPNIQMKKYLSLLRHCIKTGYRYCPIYTLDDNNQLIDISLVIFPHSQGEKDFTGLKRIIREFLSNYPIWSFMGCQEGLFSLYTNYKTIHYTYDRNDIEKFMVLYKKERDISLKRGSRHFINPSPQTKEEYEYRTKVGEICVGKKKV